MVAQTTYSSTPDSPTSLEYLVVQAELGQDEIVRTGMATLYPADTVELLNVLELPEVKHKVFAFLELSHAAAALSLVSPHTKTRWLSDCLTTQSET